MSYKGEVFHNFHFSDKIFSIQFSHSVVSGSLQPHGLQHARLPCPSPASGVYSLVHRVSGAIQPYHPLSPPVFLPSVFPSVRVFPSESVLRIRWPKYSASAASLLAMNIQDWFPLWLTGLISLQSRGLSRVFSNATVQKHQFFSAQLSL